ncbi:hypothetical protein pb186bvf_005003 [Paramecium bursaria]
MLNFNTRTAQILIFINIDIIYKGDVNTKKKYEQTYWDMDQIIIIQMFQIYIKNEIQQDYLRQNVKNNIFFCLILQIGEYIQILLRKYFEAIQDLEQGVS